ncbi:putative enzyme [Candidatus Zixiibacteriota bacterium]|nr:putative enzyme [candidate division Zixibacteria bacterium]
MKIPIYQVDAFTGKLFGGNPAAVCPLERWIPDDLMQNIAAENNLSETAFFIRRDEHFEIRWFTPVAEINLAGHPTLATGHVLFNHLGFEGNRIVFMSKGGELIVTRTGTMISLNFPADKPRPIEMPDNLVEALGKEPAEILTSRDIFAVYKSPDDIINLKPNFDLLGKIDAHAVIVTAPGTDCDFLSRFFAPRLGINEDPVTGSAHTALIPFWAERLGKRVMHAHQESKRRGEIFCEFLGNRVLISGQAVTFFIGEITF